MNFDALTESAPGSGTSFISNCYVESGFRFTAVGVPCAGDDAADAFLAGNSNSPIFGFGDTPALVLNSASASAIDIARVDGTSFSLFSLGLAPFDMAETQVLFTGTLLGGGTVTESATLLADQMGFFTLTLPSTFSGVTSVRIEAENEFAEPYVIIDDLRASVVPEPSTYALMAAGLAALTVVARRRRPRF